MKRLISKVGFGISVLFLTSVGALVEANLHLTSRADSRGDAIRLRKDGQGNFGINFRNGRDLRAQYTGAGLTSGENLLALEQGQVRPLSLASDDVNLDGFPDLICG